MRASTLIGALAAAGFLAGCSGAMQNSANAIPGSGTSQTRTYSEILRSGASPKYADRLRTVDRFTGDAKPAYAGLKDLYVAAYGGDTVEVLKNKSYKQMGAITNGLDGADGEFLDKAGNLYVANYEGITIAEYAPGATSPSFTYNANMSDPINVTADAQGNVYEADYGSAAVNEYAQESNTAIESCSPGGGVEGIAVDKHGDVFVDYNVSTTSSTTGYIVEYPGGLAGCNEQTLGVTLHFAGGMAIDKHGNLVVCDQEGPAVDVIAAPYTHITGTLGTGFADPFHVTISKTNKLAFVADIGNEAVYVLHYPSGSLVKTLGPSIGITDPSAAVDGPNAVY